MTIAIDLASLEGVVPNYPFSRGSKLAMPPQSFVCSPYSLEDPNSLNVNRYATAFITSDRVAQNGGPIIFRPQTRLLWNHGQGDNASSETGFVTKGGVALPLGLAQTNALKEGAIPKGGEWFLVESMGVVLGQVCNLDVDVTGGTMTPIYITSAHLSFYEEAIARALLGAVTLNMNYEDTKNESDLGLIGQYPGMCQPTNHRDVVANGTPMAGADMKMAFNYFTGSRCGCDQINMRVVLKDILSIDGNTDTPTEADEIWTMPVRIELYGATYCLSTLEALVEQAGGELSRQFTTQR